MKRTLYLYIFKEIPPPFLIGIATFTFMLLMGRFLKLAEMVVEKGVPVADVMRMVAYLLPSFWLYTIPMALLLAVLLAFGRLSSDSEVTAMKSCGVSLYGMLPPPIVFALLCCVLCSWITIYAVPWGNLAFKKLIIEVAQNKAGVVLKERVFNDAFPGLVVYTEEFDQKRQTMRGVIIHDERNPKDPSTVFAKEGALIADPGERSMEFHLKDGSIHHNAGKDGYRLVEFQGYDLRVALAQGDKKAEKSESEMTMEELRRPPPGLSAKDLMSIRLEYYSRMALPFSCLVFTLLAMPLGIQNRRSGKAAGFSLSIGVLLLYYIALSGFKTMGERGVLTPAQACWAPNLVFFILGAYLFRKAAIEEQLPLAAPLGRAIRAVRGMLSRGGRG